MTRPSQAIINLSAVNRNFDKLSALAGNSKRIAVVKADAYGNGAVAIANTIKDRVDMFAVAFLDEAIALRENALSADTSSEDALNSHASTKPILILQGAHEAADYAAGAAHNLIWVMHSEWQLAAYRAHIQQHSCQARAWFKFDTGMHRLGFSPSYLDTLLLDYPELINEHSVMMTHLACADEPNQGHAVAQIDRFLEILQQHNFPVCIANSAGNIRFQQARQDYVRLGIALYGSSPFNLADQSIQLDPVMSLNSKIIALRSIPKGDCVGYGATWRAPQDSVIATVPIGYADGYPRHAPTGTPAWCNGQLVPLVGRVSMDMLTFDVTALLKHSSAKAAGEFEPPQIGHAIQLWGDKLPINQVAEHIGTIGYELMTRISKRVPRLYIKD